MNDLLQAEDIAIKIFYHFKPTKHGSKKLTVLSKKQASCVEDAQSIEAIFKSPTWKDENTILKSSTVVEGEKANVDWLGYQDKRLKSSIKTWDLKNVDGNDIELNDENIDKLPAVLVKALLGAFDKVSSIDEKEMNAMILALSDILHGRKVAQPVPAEINEFFMIKEYRWTLHDIRSLSARDFHIFSMLASTANKIENSIQNATVKRSQTKVPQSIVS
jgi:hypothetical protein